MSSDMAQVTFFKNVIWNSNKNLKWVFDSYIEILQNKTKLSIW